MVSELLQARLSLWFSWTVNPKDESKQNQAPPPLQDRVGSAASEAADSGQAYTHATLTRHAHVLFFAMRVSVTALGLALVAYRVVGAVFDTERPLTAAEPLAAVAVMLGLGAAVDAAASLVLDFRLILRTLALAAASYTAAGAALQEGTVPNFVPMPIGVACVAALVLADVRLRRRRSLGISESLAHQISMTPQEP